MPYLKLVAAQLDIERLFKLPLDCNYESITDDNMLLENIGVQPYCVDTSSENIKITTREDLLLAEFIIRKREEL